MTDLASNLPSSPRRHRRSVLQVTGIGALAIAGLIALNEPITFADASASASATSPVVSSAVGATRSTSVLAAQQATSGTVETVAKAASPSVVTITNLQTAQGPRSTQSSDLQPVGIGSGYIIDAQGHVVTNNHVVEGGASFSVELTDGTAMDATLVGADPYQDVAVLKLEPKKGQTLPAALTFGNSDDVQVGEQVVAIGSPLGDYTDTVTAGMINNDNRSLDTGEGYLLPNLLQHDADIYPGNSGGPLLDLSGKVIGMNVAKAVDPSQGYPQETGIAFAIKSNAVKEIVDQIIAKGSYARSFLGIQSQPTSAGQDVVAVEQGSPAATAGLQVGDVITGIDGEPVSADNPFVNQLLFDHKPGDKVTLSVDRNGSTTSIPVTLGTRPTESQ